MIDYNEHPYKDLLRFIENECQQHNERRDYVSYFLSMEHAASIEELIKKFDNLFKLLAIFCFGTNKMPNRWYLYKQWKVEYAQQAENLLQYLNKTILDYYNRIIDPTEDQVNSCIINLRDCNNKVEIQNSIIKNAKSWDVISNRDNFFSQNETLNFLGKGCQDYNSQKIECERNIKVIVYKGRVLDVREIAFCKYHLIDYEKILPYYEQGKENREKEQLENEKAELEQKKRESKTNLYAILLMLILNTVYFIYLFTSFKSMLDDICYLYAIIISFLILGAIIYYIYDRKEKQGHKLSKVEQKIKNIPLYIVIFAFIMIPIIFFISLLFNAIGGFFGLIVIIGMIGAIPKLLIFGKF